MSPYEIPYAPLFSANFDSKAACTKGQELDTCTFLFKSLFTPFSTARASLKIKAEWNWAAGQKSAAGLTQIGETNCLYLASILKCMCSGCEFRQKSSIFV
jgi:hypothetical protein